MMQKRTPLKYSSAVKDDYISVTVSGYFSLYEAKKMYSQILEILHDKKRIKLFFNVCKVKGKIKTMDRYDFGEYAAIESINFQLKGLKKIAVAFYGLEPIIDPERFGELVAKNRGLNIKVTTDKKEALNFLETE